MPNLLGGNEPKSWRILGGITAYSFEEGAEFYRKNSALLGWRVLLPGLLVVSVVVVDLMRRGARRDVHTLSHEATEWRAGVSSGGRWGTVGGRGA